jgi:hypothetical protein
MKAIEKTVFDLMGKDFLAITTDCSTVYLRSQE